MDALAGGGVMVAVEASEEEVSPYLTEGVSVAAVNAPGSVVVSGEAGAVQGVVERFAGLGRRTRSLAVSHAFHSVLMEPMLEEFRRVVEGVSFGPARLSVVSTLSGGVAGAEFSTPEYWVRQVREAVRFADAVEWLAGEGVSTFLEVGPDAALSPMAVRCLDDQACVVPFQRREQDETVTALRALAELFVHGTPVDWTKTLPGAPSRQVPLPTYAFQHERYWPAAVTGMGGGADFGLDAAFWDVVEREDPEELSRVLAVAGDASLGEVVPALASWRRGRRERFEVDGWRYRAVWRPAPVGPSAEQRLSGRWLAVIPAGTAEQADIREVLAALSAAGAEVVPVEVGADADRN
ncbi:acyltransferase domain-containing protein, partial [Streptomyces graminilatus]|uniref:acyltransferase domain-containing protein n=1 Tax=Streptomyces graminilatus TaxID=1464070 RepID=UPI001F52391C